MLGGSSPSPALQNSLYVWGGLQLHVSSPMCPAEISQGLPLRPAALRSGCVSCGAGQAPSKTPKRWNPWIALRPRDPQEASWAVFFRIPSPNREEGGVCCCQLVWFAVCFRSVWGLAHLNTQTPPRRRRLVASAHTRLLACKQRLTNMFVPGRVLQILKYSYCMMAGPRSSLRTPGAIQTSPWLDTRLTARIPLVAAFGWLSS